MKKIWISLALSCAICLAADGFDQADSLLADSTALDSISLASGADSLASAEEQEDLFQSSLDTLFQTFPEDLDTFGWSTVHINSGRFNSSTWTDTARIVLNDSAQNRVYIHPVNGVVTSQFGPRHWLWHYGVDVRLTKGDSVRAAMDGVVRVIQYDRRGFGHVVVVRHRNGLETIYGHLSKILVAPPQKIAAGDIVGLGGSTGHSTGPHLHFEMRYYGEPFDPNHIVDFQACALKQDTLVLTRNNFSYLVEIRKAVWHTVHRGQTLGHIARRYHTSVRAICRMNHITPRTVLRVGRKLLVRRDRGTRSTMAPTIPLPTKNAPLQTGPSVSAETGDESAQASTMGSSPPD
jgi:hypothetical protein